MTVGLKQQRCPTFWMNHNRWIFFAFVIDLNVGLRYNQHNLPYYNIRWLLRAMVRLGLKGCAPFLCVRVAWIGAGAGAGHEKIRLLNGVRHARVNFAGPTSPAAKIR
jgi:hypothetical protein